MSGRESYDAAAAHDRAGREAEAIPFYERAIEEGLDDETLRRAYVGLGSSLRNVGRVNDAVLVLGAGVRRFPDYAPLRVFLGLALWSAGRQADAFRELLEAVGDVDGYEEPARRYAAEL